VITFSRAALDAIKSIYWKMIIEFLEQAKNFKTLKSDSSKYMLNTCIQVSLLAVIKPLQNVHSFHPVQILRYSEPNKNRLLKVKIDYYNSLDHINYQIFHKIRGKCIYKINVIEK